MADKKPIAWRGADNIPHFTASSFGGCPRVMAAALAGYDAVSPPEKLQKIYDAGHVAEDQAIAHLTDSEGWNIWGAQTTVHLPLDTRNGPVVVQGHVDGLTYIGQHPHILEIKSQGPSTFASSSSKLVRSPSLAAIDDELWTRYAWQASIYMHGFGLPLVFVRWMRDSTPEAPTWHMFTLDEPPFSTDEIAERAASVLDHTDGPLPPCDSERWGCPFSYLHFGSDDADEEETPTCDGLADLVAAYDLARRHESEAKKEKDALRDQILCLMKSNSLTKAVDGPAKVTVAASKRTTWDEALMVADGLDPDRYRVVKVSERLQVSAAPVKLADYL